MDYNLIAINHADCLEKQSLPGSQTQFIKQFSSNRLEINKVSFALGDNFSLNPPKQLGSIKIYSILSGEVYCIETRQHYRSGSSFVLQGYHDLVNISVKEAGELVIYVLGGETFQETTDTFHRVHQTMLAIQAKDEYTYNHCINVHKLVRMMIEPLGYSGLRVRHLMWAARYHDIGKIAVDDHILNKPDRLSAEEYAVMQSHVNAARDMIVEYFDEATFQIIAQHHERLDGSGYPLGLRGEAISEEARLIAICDAYDAMTSNRVYKRAKTQTEAIAELRSLSGSHYDSRIVELFITALERQEQH